MIPLTHVGCAFWEGCDIPSGMFTAVRTFLDMESTQIILVSASLVITPQLKNLEKLGRRSGCEFAC